MDKEKIKEVEKLIFENYFNFYKNQSKIDAIYEFNNKCRFILDNFIINFTQNEKDFLIENIKKKRSNFIAFINTARGRNIDISKVLDIIEFVEPANKSNLQKQRSFDGF
tara:strand:- start:754 stop:1080 length:327 start_codon:yes stop_codon:yes gene_type:complete